MITTLSAPPPLNSIYKVARNRLYKTSEAKAWQEKAAWEFKRTSKGEKFEGKVAVFINIYPHDNRRRDIDGGQKLLLDAIEDSGVIKNDYQVAVLHIERHQPDGSGRVEVLVREKI